jgi:regulator of replication initiation timing
MDRLVTDKTALTLQIFDFIDSIEEQLAIIQQQLQEVRQLVDTLATEESTDQEDPNIEPRMTTKKQSREDASRRAQQWARTLSPGQTMPKKAVARNQVRK